MLIPTGLSVRIGDPAWCGLVVPRSGLGHRGGLVLGNTIGVIDADYEGPLMISVWNRNPPHLADAAVTIAPGDRIAQFVFTRVTRPDFTIMEGAEDEDEASGRGQGGFGSTGLRG